MQRGPAAILVPAVLVGALIATMITSGCGRLSRDDHTPAEIASAAAGTLDLPLRAQRGYWFLEGEAGWQGAYRMEYGGAEGDPAYAGVQVAHFSTAAKAARAFGRLMPGYLWRRWGSRMSEPPRAAAYPIELPGDRQAVFSYGLRLPPEYGGLQLDGQLTALLAGRAVLLIDSIGVTPERFLPAAEALVEAARHWTAPQLAPPPPPGAAPARN